MDHTVRQDSSVLSDSHSRQRPRLPFVLGCFLDGGTRHRLGEASLNGALCLQTVAMMGKSSSFYKGLCLGLSGIDFWSQCPGGDSWLRPRAWESGRFSGCLGPALQPGWGQVSGEAEGVVRLLDLPGLLSSPKATCSLGTQLPDAAYGCPG